jgi:hypothetical protein
MRGSQVPASLRDLPSEDRPRAPEEAFTPRKMTLEEAIAYARAHQLRVVGGEAAARGRAGPRRIYLEQWLRDRCVRRGDRIGRSTTARRRAERPDVDISGIERRRFVRRRRAAVPVDRRGDRRKAGGGVSIFGRTQRRTAAARMNAELERRGSRRATSTSSTRRNRRRRHSCCVGCVEDASR